MGAAVGMNSVATVHEHIDRLETKRIRQKLDGTARGIEILKDNYRSGSTEASVELLSSWLYCRRSSTGTVS